MRPICTWCGTDADIDDHDPTEDVALCLGRGHPEPRIFHPAAESAARAAGNHLEALPEGMATELDLWTRLPEVLNPGEWVDTHVVEHRYGTRHPDDYRRMLTRWGHVKQSPRKYSVSSYIGSTLGHLARQGVIAHKTGVGSGFFSYNSLVGFWILRPVPEHTTDLGWADYATSLGLDPNDWPLA